LAEEKVTSGNSAVLQGNVNIHCFVCGTKVSVEGKVPGTNVNCKYCDTKLTVPDEDVLKKLASFESFTEIPSVSVVDSASSKKDSASSKKGSASSKKDSASSKKDSASSKKDSASSKKDSASAKKEAKAIPHKIFCDGCGAKIDVSDQPVASRFSCPACGMVLRVPERIAPAEAKEEKTESKDSKSKDKKPSTSSDKKSSSSSEKKPDSSVSGSPTLEKLKINCHTCGAKIDVTHEESFKKVNCPACNAIFQIPKRFNHFLLEERLGENDNFSAYRALDLTLSREVCLKVMSKKLSSQKDQVDKFLSVAGKIALVNDPNIVPIYSSGEHDGMSFLVMQFMAASSLDPYLEKAKGLLPLNSVYRCVKDASKGLDAAFKQGINHNNISLKNILVDRDGNIKVSDFGYSYALHQLEKSNDVTAFFNPLYLSLEMAKKGENNLSGDIYSLGAVFYHLITGVPPFPGNNPKEILKQRLERKPVAPYKVRSEVPQDVSDYIVKMMSDEPSERPSSFAEVSKQIEKFSAAEPSTKKESSSGIVAGLGSASSSTGELSLGSEGSSATSAEGAPEGEEKKPNMAIVGGIAAAVILILILLFTGGEPKVDPAVVAAPAVPAPVGVSNPVDSGNPVDAAVPVSGDPVIPPVTGVSADAPTVQRGYPVKTASRPMPAGISFRSYTEKLIEYMELHQGLHEGNTYKQEVERIKILRSTKEYLETLLRFLPYKGKLYVKGGAAIDGEIVGASVKEMTVIVDGEEVALSWNKFETRQFLDIIEFYIEKKKSQLENATTSVVEEVKKNIADDYFRAALISDWYQETGKLQSYVKNCLRYNPSLRPQVETFLPSINE
jgi:predicted RNA-binding Zn-ribbon protein involved in translation (DUF1610 family)